MIVLRENQKCFLAATRLAMRSHRRVCAVAPTGFGKRIVMCYAMSTMVDKGKRAVIVTDRRTLIRQAANECKEHDIPYGIRMGDMARNNDAPVQLCSLQTLERRNWTDNPHADVMFIDEAHKSPEQYKKLMVHYPDAWIIGMTATPVGTDDRLLLGLYETIIEPIRNSDLIPEWLLPTQVICPLEPDVQGVYIDTKRLTVDSSSGEFNGTQSSVLVETLYTHADIWKYYKPYAHMQAIAFVPRVAFGEFLVKEFSKRNIAAELIHAGTSDNDRVDMFRRFDNRETRTIVSVDVIREGFDAPIAQLMIDLQPNAKLRTWVQKVGRIRRKYGDQQHGVCLDFCGNFHRLGWHPDDDPEWPTDATTTTAEVRTKKEEKKGIANPWECPKCTYQLSPCEKVMDGECPNCGLELKKAKRRIVMGNGGMRQVPARSKPKPKTDPNVAAWFQSLYPIVRSGKQLNVARFIFKKNTGHWPDHKKLPKCPEPGSGDWKRPARKVFPELVK